MRRTLIMVAALAAAVLAGSVSIAPARAVTPTNFKVTLRLTVTEIQCGLGCTATVTGRAVVPRIGPAIITGFVSAGCSEQPAPEPELCQRNFDVSVLGNNARQLTINGGTSWLEGEPIPPGTWTASSAGFLGSGTETTEPSDPLGLRLLRVGDPVVITLTGTLLPA
jgi:hypothetical protein